MDIQIVIFDPHYLIFSFGISLHRYEEYNEDYTLYRVRRVLEIGLIFATINFNFHFNKPLPDGGLEDI
jgi:hypothetical protein